jgi:hypothetical protein
MNPEISFVDYMAEAHTYKVKPQYLEIAKEFMQRKMQQYGISEDVIKVDGRYTVTMISLVNFFAKDFYNEEIINALFTLYSPLANNYKYILFNTLAYHHVEATLASNNNDNI